MKKRHVTGGGWLGVLLLLYSWQSSAQTQSSIDTILTTRGASTLISCGAPISIFQIGDGKNTDYDYRIVDGNQVFVRPVVATPRTTNLIVKEGNNVHYFILAFQNKAGLAGLRYTLSGGGGAAKSSATLEPQSQPDNSPPAPAGAVAGNSKGIPVVTEEADPAATSIAIDTLTVGGIAEDFRKQKKVSHQYEARAGGVTINYANAMMLSNLIYFCYRIKNRSQQPYELAKVTMMYKDGQNPDRIVAMPVLYKKTPPAIGKKDDDNVVFVVPAREFKPNDEVIVVLQNTADQNQLVLYTPVKAFPKYMTDKK